MLKPGQGLLTAGTVYVPGANNGLLALRIVPAVIRPVPRMESISLLPDRSVRMQMSGGPGNFALEAAPDLFAWTSLTNRTSSSPLFEYIDPAPAATNWCYRPRGLP